MMVIFRSGLDWDRDHHGELLGYRVPLKFLYDRKYCYGSMIVDPVPFFLLWFSFIVYGRYLRGTGGRSARPFLTLSLIHI